MYDANGTKESKQVNEEVLNYILNEPQAEVQIDDGEVPVFSPTLTSDSLDQSKIKNNEEEKIPRTSTKTLMAELEENKEVFSNSAVVSFSSFSILEKVGSGAFGSIYKVEHKETRRIYAMKAISKKFLFTTKQLKYALTECQVLKTVNHTFVIKMHYAFQTPKYLYFILDYCNGGDLSMHLNNKHIFEEDEARFYIAELILAIEYLHSLNIIYRDLKPDNVLLGNDGHIKLSDFGLAKQMYGSMPPESLSFCGSPAYLSPEMLLKKGPNKPIDIYGIGTILFELLVGLPPYYDSDMKAMFVKISSGKLKIPNYVSAEAKNVLKVILFIG